MGWWFGRTSAPADARPFVPAWLQDDAAEHGFARSVEGKSLYVKVSGSWRRIAYAPGKSGLLAART
jgi:hypothetical protein